MESYRTIISELNILKRDTYFQFLSQNRQLLNGQQIHNICSKYKISRLSFMLHYNFCKPL